MRLIISVLFCATLAFSSHSFSFDRSQVAVAPEHVSPLLNGQTVPDANLTTLTGAEVSLRDVVQQKPTVILFYRGGWCPYCNAQLAEFAKVEQQIADLGYQILAVSPETPERLRQQSFDTGYGATLLSDHDLDVIRAFGLAFFLDDKTAQRYREAKGNVFATLPSDNRIVLPVPAAYIIDTQGLIRFQYVNPNYKVRVSPQLMYHAAKEALEQD
ncbi:Peroxiredoxin [Saliniradius amylolyticus]|uniref:thioredoxin-dependent peroxiredoxin n=1 Tax=Saliniradius amylolyticus TaxID=2183582 RepID=A0A2S2E6W3_9ALTE|nr:peroxiredoxin-like family protein [Saliniradius amylolyticus]AWL13349.1 Peroxiredoxin [Saliniradius amylolyticus]